MRYWTVCVEEDTKRLVPGYMHSRDCNLKFRTREECLHECEMQQIIRDYQAIMEGDPAGLEQLFKCLKSVATGYSIGSTMRSILLKLELIRKEIAFLTEKGFNLLLYLHKT